MPFVTIVLPAERCPYCGLTLETDKEIEHNMCEGCAIDYYEEQQRRREQRWLESQ